MPPEPTPVLEAPALPPQPLLVITNVVYGLQGFGILFPPAFIAAVIINYVKLDDARGTLVESHFRWQIRTFWFGLLWGVLGGLTAIILVGFVVLVADAIWIMYRVIKGWLDLLDRKPMYRFPSR
ncbi:MAG: DUF4870 family protein [Sulfurifustaceae bacterium]